MINKIIGKVFGTQNERELKRVWPRVGRINALEPEMQKLSDDQLRAKTDEFRKRIRDRLATVTLEADEDNPDRIKQFEKAQAAAIEEILDEILEEAFAVVREAGRRVLNIPPINRAGILSYRSFVSELPVRLTSLR